MHQLNHEVTYKDEQLKWVDREMTDRQDAENIDLKHSVVKLNQECLDLKATYASQVVQTNRDKEDYYFTALPAVLNRWTKLKKHVVNIR